MKNKIALVTGASSGIGYATVETLLNAGCTVYAAARRMDRLAPLAARGARICLLDVTDDASLRDAVAAIIQEAGRIDFLINNAGYGSFGALEDVPMAEVRRQVEVNLFGLARLTQLVLPHMRRQRSGRIVNISSVGGKIYEPFGAWYHATKFAVEGLSDSLRLELKPFGIDVVLIEPGGIATEWSTIAVENLLKTSGNTAYAEGAHAMARVVSVGHNSRFTSPPEVVARGIIRALEARRPKARYPVGKGAWLMVSLRKFLSDSLMDKFLLLTFKTVSRPAKA
jgi:NAD(P)-dependent dehydrogenase (short-subunit alcohol dehydrogenase family)